MDTILAAHAARVQSGTDASVSGHQLDGHPSSQAKSVSDQVPAVARQSSTYPQGRRRRLHFATACKRFGITYACRSSWRFHCQPIRLPHGNGVGLCAARARGECRPGASPAASGTAEGAAQRLVTGSHEALGMGQRWAAPLWPLAVHCLRLHLRLPASVLIRLYKAVGSSPQSARLRIPSAGTARPADI
ncbi:hypothetical protein WJX72_012092 [[Myrmecia] bisecta]|uniref:Uncharacterized protein n=1 Tax=[Myrmecia] bisecta TaxID=41462 RepID=A0AAW1PL61_9CHLO